MKNAMIGLVAVAVCAATMSAAAGSFHRQTKPIERTDDAPQEVRSSPLFRKTMVVIGDSYVQNHHRPIEETWHYRLAEKYQMEYHNYGRNGNTLVMMRDRKWGAPVARRYGEMKAPADYVVVVAGHNDAGVISTNEVAAAEFREGLTNFVTRLKAKYPAAQIVFVSPWNVERGGFPAVLSAYRELLPQLGVAFYDAAALSGIDPQDKDGGKAKLWQSERDTAHLSYAGHTKMLEKIEPFFLSLPTTTGGTRSCASLQKRTRQHPRDAEIALISDSGLHLVGGFDTIAASK